MSTFLQLVNDTVRESGASEPTLTTVEADLTVQGARFVNWVRDAWTEIQNMHDDWYFLIVSSTSPVPQYASVVTPTEYDAGTVAMWNIRSFRLAADGAGFADSTSLSFVPWDQFRIHEGIDSASYGKPHSFSIRVSDEAIVLAPSADLAYELFYDYIRTPQTLTLNTDVPLCPAQYHQAIVGAALKRYAEHENAPDAMAKGKRMFNANMRRLERRQRPPVGFGAFPDVRA